MTYIQLHAFACAAFFTMTDYTVRSPITQEKLITGASSGGPGYQMEAELAGGMEKGLVCPVRRRLQPPGPGPRYSLPH